MAYDSVDGNIIAVLLVWMEYSRRAIRCEEDGLRNNLSMRPMLHSFPHESLAACEYQSLQRHSSIVPVKVSTCYLVVYTSGGGVFGVVGGDSSS